MKKKFLGWALTAAFGSGLIMASGCFKNPVTGRSSLALVDDGTMNSLAATQYKEFLTKNPPVADANAQKVKTVGNKLATAIKSYFAQRGEPNALNGFNWEFNYVKNNEANAWCMPGGKVVVYSGIMPYANSDAALAVVMGHEIAHAIAKHGGERMSQGLVQQLGGVALSVALSSKPAETQQLFNTAYGVTSQVGVMLPFSRLHESEADRMGLIFMAMAGYDPNEAIGFWTRMSQKGGSKPPELLSTHPSDQTRIANLKKEIPEAMKYYKK